MSKRYDDNLINAFLSSYKPSVIQKNAGISKYVRKQRKDILIFEILLKLNVIRL